MAVDASTYGTVALTHDRIGWVVPSRAAFDGTTTPTESEVEVMLDAIASEIHAALLEAGYPASTKAVVTAAAPKAAAWLERLNVAGACAEVLQSFPVANDSETGNSPEVFWRRIYDNGKKLIQGVFLERMGLTRTYHLSDNLVSTATEDENGIEKEPFFKRGMWDVPGSNVGVFPNEDISYGE